MSVRIGACCRATEHLLCGGGPWLLKKMVQRDLDLRATRINAYGHSFDEAFYSAVRANPKNGCVNRQIAIQYWNCECMALPPSP